MGSGTLLKKKKAVVGTKTQRVNAAQLEETGYERQQTTNIKTTVMQFMLEAP